MDTEIKVLNENAGKCIYPVVDVNTGKKSKLCGEITLLDSGGNANAFCSKHWKELLDIYAHVKSLKKKKGTAGKVIKRSRVVRNK